MEVQSTEAYVFFFFGLLLFILAVAISDVAMLSAVLSQVKSEQKAEAASVPSTTNAMRYCHLFLFLTPNVCHPLSFEMPCDAIASAVNKAAVAGFPGVSDSERYSHLCNYVFTH